MCVMDLNVGALSYVKNFTKKCFFLFIPSLEKELRLSLYRFPISFGFRRNFLQLNNVYLNYKAIQYTYTNCKENKLFTIAVLYFSR